MKKQRVYFYPSAGKGGYKNPYCINYKQAIAKRFQLLDAENKETIANSWALLRMSFKADIFIMNWLESICFHQWGKLQYYLARIALKIIRLRQKKIVWMFHNIHPHQGENVYTIRIQNFLFANADLIISHSEDAALIAQSHTNIPVYYRCHPVKVFSFDAKENVESCDVFIWGTILPYKGIVEFLSYLNDWHSNLKIVIIGECTDNKLAQKINEQCKENIIYHNRKADFNELASYIKHCKYVVFPYIGDCVSSSGALIDSIVMGATVCGPNQGAFKDLHKDGVALVYNSYEDLLNILSSDIRIPSQRISTFIENNNWDSFADFLYRKLQEIR